MKSTPLREEHIKLGAKLIEFHGWEMPVQYDGVISEHLSVRNNVGLFDLTHMGEFLLTGRDALRTLNYVATNDSSKLEVGEIQYTLLTNEQGGIVDDILVYRVPEGFYLVVNASNVDKDYQWISQRLVGECRLENLSNSTALLAVQGPKARVVVEKVLNRSFSDLKYYTFMDLEYKQMNLRVSRTGYTGEDGFELYMPNSLASELWKELLKNGEEEEIRPVGLGARDTLRLEMRMSLYGNDIDETTTPIEAGLGKFISFEKGDFIGRDHLLEQKEKGISRKLVAFILRERGVPRQGYPITNGDEEIGIVTSGSMSPSRQEPIGMGYVPLDLAKPGQQIFVKVRNKHIPAEVIRGRFVKPSK